MCLILHGVTYCSVWLPNHNFESVFQLSVFKTGLVDLWKWRVWVKQKEEALLKVILKKKQFILELHNFGGNSGLLGKRLKETEKSNRAPTLRLTSLTQLHRSLLTTFRSKSKCLFFSKKLAVVTKYHYHGHPCHHIMIMAFIM